MIPIAIAAALLLAAYVLILALCRSAAQGDKAEERKQVHGERFAMQMRESDWRWPSQREHG